jgi:pimeloyl-ACP methyl ester carboxylesterase
MQSTLSDNYHFASIMKTLVLFAHGKESGPWGSKIKFLARIANMQGADVQSPDYSTMMNPDARVESLLSLPLVPHEKLVMVGSSMGGYVSTVASQILKPAGLFLLAPALYVKGYDNQDPKSGADRTAIVAGWQDEIIPVDNSIRFAKNYSFDLHLLDDDHRLSSSLPQVGKIFDEFLGSILLANKC